jgi:hypothetical protein
MASKKLVCETPFQSFGGKRIVFYKKYQHEWHGFIGYNTKLIILIGAVITVVTPAIYSRER